MRSAIARSSVVLVVAALSAGCASGPKPEVLSKMPSPAKSVKLSLVRDGKPLTLTVPAGALGVELLGGSR
ncbi:hypothetical protein [Polyangium aurulentum]|uniref:hypothetical protein n=1 Tax=Polyangium aurulentum TaxID=2567896 RepID=UPI0010AE3DBA|nr:hypothetical protein [Polyangium aurulentum]UQA57282.1 hypothetical protein E8A73_039290 [Polyangium aurulentum]